MALLAADTNNPDASTDQRSEDKTASPHEHLHLEGIPTSLPNGVKADRARGTLATLILSAVCFSASYLFGLVKTGKPWPPSKVTKTVATITNAEVVEVFEKSQSRQYYYIRLTLEYSDMDNKLHAVKVNTDDYFYFPGVRPADVASKFIGNQPVIKYWNSSPSQWRYAESDDKGGYEKPLEGLWRFFLIMLPGIGGILSILGLSVSIVSIPFRPMRFVGEWKSNQEGDFLVLHVHGACEGAYGTWKLDPSTCSWNKIGRTIRIRSDKSNDSLDLTVLDDGRLRHVNYSVSQSDPRRESTWTQTTTGD